jgi:hypothetical protein
VAASVATEAAGPYPAAIIAPATTGMILSLLAHAQLRDKKREDKPQSLPLLRAYSNHNLIFEKLEKYLTET